MTRGTRSSVYRGGMADDPRPTRGIALGRVFGARVIVQPSTLLMLVLLAVLFSTNSGGELNRRTFTAGLLLAVLLFASVFLHELAHAAAARAFRRRVREVVITLWGGHTSFDAEAMTPRVSGLTAAAGPAANLLIASAVAGIVQTGIADRVMLENLGAGGMSLRSLLLWVAFANLLLALFNSLPGIPMDGGRVLEAIVWAVTRDRFRATTVAAWSGRIVAILVVIAMLGWPALNGRSPQLFELVWAGLIFMILWPAASAALKASQIMGRRARVTAGTVMRPALGVAFDVTVADARASALAAGADEVVVLAADGTPAGHFPVALTDAVPESERATTGLAAVTMPLARGSEVDPSLTGDPLIETLKLWWGRTDAWPVVDDGQVVGVVRLSEMMAALQ